MEAHLRTLADGYQSLDRETRHTAIGFIAAVESYGDSGEAERLRAMLANQQYRELANRMLTIRIQGR